MGNWGRKVGRADKAKKTQSMLDNPGYAAAVSKALARANQWVAAHGRGGLAFTLPPAEVGLIATPTAEIISWLAPTEAGRAFLRALDQATERESTVLMLCAIVRALDLPVEEWSESRLAELLQRGGEPS